MELARQIETMQNTGWEAFLEQEAAKPYFAALDAFVTERMEQAEVYPPKEQIFAALRACRPENVRVVVLGQDPYHEPRQAMGLSFSVPQGCKAPPSLRNIFKELAEDVGVEAGDCTDLTPWAEQGVLLLNTVLTVEKGAAFSHAGQGWETLTRAALEWAAAAGNGPLAALLWGKPAQKYAPIFTQAAAHRPVQLLQAPHPSPLSAYRGFFGSAPFSQINAFLQKEGARPICWQL